jgi:hypothetical protein
MALIDHVLCPRVPRLMLAVYDDFALFREGSVCGKEERPLLRVPLTPEQRSELLQDIDVNPLLFEAQSPVEFCPRCVGREIDLIALARGSRIFKIAVVGAESDAEPEGADGVQRDGARAAAALVRSLNRVRPGLSRGETQRWTEEVILFSRMYSDDPMTRAPHCRWPTAWQLPEGISDLEPGNSLVLQITTGPTKDEFKAYTRNCSVIDIRGNLFLVGLRATFPGQVGLGLPFAKDLLLYCR